MSWCADVRASGWATSGCSGWSEDFSDGRALSSRFSSARCLGAVGGIIFAMAGSSDRRAGLPKPRPVIRSRPTRRSCRPTVPFGPFLALAAGAFALFQPQLDTLVSWRGNGTGNFHHARRCRRLRQNHPGRDSRRLAARRRPPRRGHARAGRHARRRGDPLDLSRSCRVARRCGGVAAGARRSRTARARETAARASIPATS